MQQIQQDIDQKILFPYSYEKILKNAIGLSLSNGFPATTNADYYAYKLTDGVTVFDDFNKAYTYCTNRFAGLVARE